MLRFFRLRKGVTKGELASACGISAHTVDRWENGAVPLSYDRLVEVLAVLGIPSEAADAALFADWLANPPAEPGPIPGEASRLIRRAAVAGGWAGARAASAELSVDFLRRQAPRHRRWAAERWAGLKTLSAPRQDAALRVLLGDERSWALAERLCAASTAAAAHRADEARRLAQLAVRVAGQVPGDERWRLRLQGYCENFLANALRVEGDYNAAALAFSQADKLWSQGEGGDPAGLLDSTRRLDLKASFLKYQGHNEEALALLENALEGARTDAARGRLLIQKATTLEFAGKFEEALQALDRAEPFIEANDHRTLILHKFNKCVNLAHLDLYREAEALLSLVEVLAADLNTELTSVRVRWLKGRIASGLGRTAEAMAALTQVRQHFNKEQMAYDYALVSLELATLHLEQGRTRLVQEMADEMMWIFNSQRVHEYALAALALFCQAARKEEAQADWTRRLIKYLYRAQHNPDLRFEP